MNNTQAVVNVCPKCELKMYHWPDYSAHIQANNCIKAIKPIRTTTRTKAEIVEQWEYRHHKHLIY